MYYPGIYEPRDYRDLYHAAMYHQVYTIFKAMDISTTRDMPALRLRDDR
jgi:hypothetical protein